MKHSKSKRITVTVDVDVPVNMTIGETDAWIEGRFPKSARAQCIEQRACRPRWNALRAALAVSEAKVRELTEALEEATARSPVWDKLESVAEDLLRIHNEAPAASPPVDQGAEHMGAVELPDPFAEPIGTLEEFIARAEREIVAQAHHGKQLARMRALIDAHRNAAATLEAMMGGDLAAPVADTPREEAPVDPDDLPDDGQDRTAATRWICQCAAIQAADASRHFKGCPRRVEKT